MDDSVGHVMYEREELSELQNEVYGECRSDERCLVNVMSDECFASLNTKVDLIYLMCFLCLCIAMGRGILAQ